VRKIVALGNIDLAEKGKKMKGVLHHTDIIWMGKKKQELIK